MKSNPSKYRALSEPFASAGDADKALAAFWRLVEAARDLHKIPDVIVTVGLSYMADGDECDVSTDAQYGDLLRHESLVATTFGRIQAERQALIGKILAKAVMVGPKK